MRQFEVLPQPALFRLAEGLDIVPLLRTSHRRTDNDEQYLYEPMSLVVFARVRHTAEMINDGRSSHQAPPSGRSRRECSMLSRLASSARQAFTSQAFSGNCVSPAFSPPVS